MKTRNRITNWLSSVALAVAMISLWAVWPISRVEAIGDPTDGKYGLGLARGQTARLTVINSGEERGFVVDWKFLDNEGRPLAQSHGPVEMLPGQMQSFDLDGDALNSSRDRFGRIQFRAKVDGRGQRRDLNHNFQILVEIFDNDTGKTTATIYSSPESD
ncbi:MAG: hypothetical protein H0U18_06070 [Pyrinomonadaceae bacterium]|nr:hypothetical protein [Pyrinomonadaceae bacterium]